MKFFECSEELNAETRSLQLALAKILMDKNIRDIIEYVEIKKGKKDVSIT